MIRFFRTIPQSLLAQGGITRCFTNAAGEIVLVVVGIGAHSIANLKAILAPLASVSSSRQAPPGIPSSAIPPDHVRGQRAARMHCAAWCPIAKQPCSR